MANILLSEAEKTFILHGVKDDFRSDGRSRRDYRSMELETDIVSHASGSARVRLANTDILVGVKTEIDVPIAGRPDEGKIEFFVDCSANATPEFEGRGGEELALEIANTLQKAYSSNQAFDLTKLIIIRKRQCWKLFVDILILECGGNLFDTVSIAVKSALYNTRIPSFSTALIDGGNVDLTLSDDIYVCNRLSVESIPLLVTMCKVGDHCVVDPSGEEEACSSATLVIGVSYINDKGYVTTSRTYDSGGSFLCETLIKTVQLGLMAGEVLNKKLLQVLENEEKKFDTQEIGNKEVFGFLK